MTALLKNTLLRLACCVAVIGVTAVLAGCADKSEEQRVTEAVTAMLPEQPKALSCARTRSLERRLDAVVRPTWRCRAWIVSSGRRDGLCEVELDWDRSEVVGAGCELSGEAVPTYASDTSQRSTDCRGGSREDGVELAYRVSPRYGTERSPTIDRRLDRTVDIICQRIDALEVKDGHARREGRDRILLQLPSANERLKMLAQPGRLYFYDFERTVIGSKRRPIRGLFDAVERASREKPGKDSNNTTGPQVYLFKADGTLRAGPDPTRKLLLSEFGGVKPKEDKIVTVPAGTVVVRADRPDGFPALRKFNRFHVLKDNPELSGRDIKQPEQNFDQATSEPVVTFDFTRKGRKRFHTITRRLAKRGRALHTPGRSPDRAYQTFAVVVDREIVTRPFIDFKENPNGIDGRTGALISGGFTIQSAQDLAAFLSIDPLPIDLKLIGRKRFTK